jgi:hypothetical protein
MKILENSYFNFLILKHITTNNNKEQQGPQSLGSNEVPEVSFVSSPVSSCGV